MTIKDKILVQSKSSAAEISTPFDILKALDVRNTKTSKATISASPKAKPTTAKATKSNSVSGNVNKVVSGESVSAKMPKKIVAPKNIKQVSSPKGSHSKIYSAKDLGEEVYVNEDQISIDDGVTNSHSEDIEDIKVSQPLKHKKYEEVSVNRAENLIKSFSYGIFGLLIAFKNVFFGTGIVFMSKLPNYLSPIAFILRNIKIISLGIINASIPTLMTLYMMRLPMSSSFINAGNLAIFNYLSIASVFITAMFAWILAIEVIKFIGLGVKHTAQYFESVGRGE